MAKGQKSKINKTRAVKQNKSHLDPVCPVDGELNGKSSEDNSIEPRCKKGKWESFATAQKYSHVYDLSTDSLRRWFPDFKLLSETSMEVEQDAQSSSTTDENNSDTDTDGTLNENESKNFKESGLLKAHEITETEGKRKVLIETGINKETLVKVEKPAEILKDMEEDIQIKKDSVTLKNVSQIIVSAIKDIKKVDESILDSFMEAAEKKKAPAVVSNDTKSLMKIVSNAEYSATAKNDPETSMISCDTRNPVNALKTAKEIDEKLPSACALCLSDENDECSVIKFVETDDICVHSNCLYFASGLAQAGEESDELLGFLVPDIQKEVRRGKNLFCSYCRKRGATIGCVVAECKKCYHLICGMQNKVLFQFFGTFNSYCKAHKPKQAKVKIAEELHCYICAEDIRSNEVESCLYPPCCKKNMFHKTCLQKLALSAGMHYFKCPLCNNTDEFKKEMQMFGINIPEKDASWELEENAFQELLVQPECDAAVCLCPRGRNHRPDKRSSWVLLTCSYCGSHARHKKCGNMKKSQKKWLCEECTNIKNKIAKDKADSLRSAVNDNKLKIEPKVVLEDCLALVSASQPIIDLNSSAHSNISVKCESNASEFSETKPSLSKYCRNPGTSSAGPSTFNSNTYELEANLDIESVTSRPPAMWGKTYARTRDSVKSCKKQKTDNQSQIISKSENFVDSHLKSGSSLGMPEDSITSSLTEKDAKVTCKSEKEKSDKEVLKKKFIKEMTKISQIMSLTVAGSSTCKSDSQVKNEPEAVVNNLVTYESDKQLEKESQMILVKAEPSAYSVLQDVTNAHRPQVKRLKTGAKTKDLIKGSRKLKTDDKSKSRLNQALITTYFTKNSNKESDIIN